MADKLFDPSNPTTSEAPPPAASAPQTSQSAPGANKLGESSVAAVAATPAPTGAAHVPTTHDASFCAAANCPPNTHPAHGNAAWPTGQTQYATDPLVVGSEYQANLAVIDLPTWRHVCGVPHDQLAGFIRWCTARHAATQMTSNAWHDLFDVFSKTAVK